MKEFFRTYLAVILGMCTVLIPMAKADPPAGNGGPGVNFSSPNSTMAIGGTSFNPTLDIAGTITPAETFNGAVTLGSTLAANGVSTFSNQLSFQSSGQTACPGPGTPIASASAPACLGPIGGTIGLVIGKASGTAWGGTTTANSSQLMFIRNNGTVDAGCALFLASGGSLQTGCSISSASNNISAGSANMTAQHYNSNAGCSGATPQTVNGFGCRITSATSTATVNFGTAFASIPVCTASDETTALALKVVPAVGSVTITGQGASDVIDVSCHGNPS